VTHHAKAPSAITAASTGTTRARRAVFGMACLCVLGLAAFAGSGAPSAGADSACPNEAIRTELHATALPDCRAYELASPGATADVMADTGRTQAAATESPGLPMAARFSSLAGFADVLGSGVAFDYLAQRDGGPGTGGWTTHAITPPQEPLTVRAVGQGIDPLYESFSSDLSRGAFLSFSSLPGTSANAQQLPNLYTRDDVRSPGAGDYRLFTDSAILQAPLSRFGGQDKPWLAGASADFQHLLFESRRNLTADATGGNFKLYKSDDGLVRLVRASSACPGRFDPTDAASPCAMAGIGATAIANNDAHYTPRVISDDGSRVNFTAPYGEFESTPSTRPGIVSKLYQLDDQGTPAIGDDAVIQLNASEKAAPEVVRAATFQTASTDGGRVFFSSAEQLTEAPGSGLYMWQRQPADETQQISIDATGGTFTVTAHAQPSYGSGTLANGSNEVTGVSGSFTVGQAISAPGIPSGATVTALGSFESPSEQRIVLSAPASESGPQALTASFDATTDPLAANATATQVREALEGLSLLGSDNVSVTGGPGAAASFEIEFTGALAGVNMMQLTADAGGLSGGASTATVATADDIRNLTLIANGASDTIGASEDGTRVYFRGGNDIDLWHDDGTSAGSLSFVAALSEADFKYLSPGQEVFWNFSRQPLSRVTPDGRSLLFEVSDGAGLPPGYQHGTCDGNENASESGFCSEVYVYRTDTSTPSDPDIVCASCNLSDPGASGDTFLNVRRGTGAAQPASHLGRALTDDGRRAYFDTTKALVPEDTNGAVDVYEHDVSSGAVHLISSGTDPANSYFMDASADGHDVFFVTAARLAGWDDDQGYDLYDARVDGGFPDPPVHTAPCEGESCFGATSATPAATAPGSDSVVAPGNPRGGRRTCPRGRRAVRRAGKTRCVKPKHHHAHRRAARDNRGGAK
jgi:hypothetical protein